MHHKEEPDEVFLIEEAPIIEGIIELPVGTDFIEEKVTADGRHITKEVHQENGITEISITEEGGFGQSPEEMIEEALGLPLLN